MDIFDKDGTILHFRDEGPAEGLPVVFSNSLGTDLRVWDAMLGLLPPGLRLFRYDKRGHGLSDCPDNDWSVEEHITDLEAMMDARGLRGAVIVGLSVGGLIAQGLAARRPELVRGLVLMDTAAKIGNDAMWNDRIAAIEAGGIESIADGILERWFTARFRAEDPTFPIWRNMLIRTPGQGYCRTGAGIRDTDLTEEARALNCPVLAMAGEDDRATPPDLVRDTAEIIPGARFMLIEDAAHLPCIEQPGITAAAIGDFLKETGHTAR